MIGLDATVISLFHAYILHGVDISGGFPSIINISLQQIT